MQGTVNVTSEISVGGLVTGTTDNRVMDGKLRLILAVMVVRIDGTQFDIQLMIIVELCISTGNIL